MYPSEWEVGEFKRRVKNQAYISNEISNFCSYYFVPHVQSRRTKVSLNDDGGESTIEPALSVFNQPGHAARQYKDDG